MFVRRALTWLLVIAVVMPIAIAVTLGTRALLAAMGDDAGATGLGRVALAIAILWVIDLICLLLGQTLDHLVQRPPEN